MSVRAAWKICGWCTRQSGRLILAGVWLGLLAALAAQAYVLSSRCLSMPEPLRRLIQQQFAEQGVHFAFDGASMDLAGRLILENVRLGPSGPRTETLATARLVYLQVDPLTLVAGRFDLEEVRVSGLDLHLPASRSASGTDRLLAGDIDFRLRPLGRELEVSCFTGYVGPVAVQASGRLRLPSRPSGPVDSGDMARRISSAYLDAARRLQTAEPWLAAVESPQLHIRLRPADATVVFHAASVDLGAPPGGPGGRLAGIQAATTLPLSLEAATPLTLSATVDSLDLPREVSARGLACRLDGTLGGGRPSPRSLELQLASLRWRGIDAGPLVASAARPSPEAVSADVSFTLAGSPWRLRTQGTPRAGIAEVRLDGWVDDATLAFAGGLIRRDLTALLDPAQPAPLHATASFSAGWKLAEVSGRLHSGPVRVGGALLDETGTEFTYDGNRVLCENLVLRQGASLAHGSYEMDTHTMDFRFLLTGGLEPAGIASWFHSWWSGFWSTFDFSRALPAADVDVRGRWGDLTATRVFVQAEGSGVGLKGVVFDRVRTRLFLRPQWFDIRHFDVALDSAAAGGSLARSLDLEKNTWTRMDFAVESSLPLATILKLFHAESSELLAPYDFTTPPRLRLNGRVDSDASPSGKGEHIDIGLSSTGPMTYHGFPLSDLNFEAALRNDVIDLPVLAVGFAGGRANGKARLWGPADARRLSFDIALADANLGAVTHAVTLLQPTAAPVSEKSAEAARLRQERLDRGRLVFALKAEGLFTDFHTFKGSGRAAITGTELGQLNLFGPLSEALRGTFLNFSSFSLTTVDAPFVLSGDRVHFDDLRVTGPSALLQAKGDYLLRDGRLDFTTKVHPFDESPSMVGSAVGFVLTPLSKVFEVKLKGTLSNPAWIFAYGPSRLLDTITGGSAKKSAPPAP